MHHPSLSGVAALAVLAASLVGTGQHVAAADVAESRLAAAPASIDLSGPFGGRTRRTATAQSGGRSFVAVSGHFGALTGPSLFKVWELGPDFKLTPLPDPPSSKATRTDMSLATKGGLPCTGYTLDDAAYVACFDGRSWQELPLPGARRADILVDLTEHGEALYAMTFAQVGFGPGGEWVYYVLRWTGSVWEEVATPLNFAGRAPRGPSALVRFGSSLGGGPGPVVGVMEGFFAGSHRRTLVPAGGSWADLVPAIKSRSGGSFAAGPIVRGSQVVLGDIENRPEPSRFSLLTGPVGPGPLSRFGTRQLNSKADGGSTVGAVYYAGRRLWAAWVTSLYDKKRSQFKNKIYTAPVDASRRRVGRPARHWSGTGLFSNAEVVDLQGQPYLMYLAPARGLLFRPVLKRLGR